MPYQEQLSEMERIAYELIDEALAMREGNVVPRLVKFHQMQEMMRERLLAALRSLCRKGIVEYHKDINHELMFGIAKIMRNDNDTEAKPWE